VSYTRDESMSKVLWEIDRNSDLQKRKVKERCYLRVNVEGGTRIRFKRTSGCQRSEEDSVSQDLVLDASCAAEDTGPKWKDTERPRGEEALGVGAFKADLGEPEV